MSRKSVIVSRACLGVLAALALLACPVEQEPDYRAQVFLDIALEQVAPDLRLAVSRAEDLHARVGELCTSPDAAHLDAAQDAWMLLREPWQRLQMLPIDDGSLATAIDFWPARPSSIEGGVALGITTQAEVDALGVASKGMPAIEYLLWDPLAGDEAVLALLTGLDGPARCAYIELLAADLPLRLGDASQGWYLVDGLSVDQLDIAELIDGLVNAMINGVHEIDDMKLGKPLGLSSGIGPDPELVESRFSDRSLLEIRDGLDGFERAYLGSEAHPGLTRLVAQKSPEIDADVRAAIDAAKQAVAAVPEPLRESINTHPDAVAEAEAAVEALRVLLIADVAGLLGVTVSLTDNDGD